MSILKADQSNVRTHVTNVRKFTRHVEWRMFDWHVSICVTKQIDSDFDVNGVPEQ